MATLTAFMQAHPTIWQAIQLIFTVVVTTAVVVVVLRLERKAARRLLEKKKDINLRFVESIVRFVVIVLAVQWVIMSSPITSPFGRILFQGTAVIGAIAGFAAQPVISDIICGLMISATKPFDIGDRIELENGMAGIVADITLRHVVIMDIDTMRRVIPNSKLNSMTVTNMSYHTRTRSAHLRFNVAYTADPERAMAVIRRAVEESPYTIPGRPGTAGHEYGPVYFISYAESSLVMATTVYFEATSPTERVKSDVNTRVKKALDASGIEIPYSYVNVVVKDGKREER